MERNYVTVTLYIGTLSCAIDSPCRARGNNASVKTGSLHGAEATRRPATGVALCASESRPRSEHVVVLVVVAVVRGDVAAVAAAVCDGFLRAISQPHHRRRGVWYSDAVDACFVVRRPGCSPQWRRRLEACPLTKSDLPSVDFVINRFSMKLFETVVNV